MQSNMKNIKSHEEKSTQDVQEILHDVLAQAKKQGASEASVNLNHDRGFSVDVRMGQVETVSFNEDRGLSVVVYLGQRKGAASSTDVSRAAIEAMVSAACNIAKVSAEEPCFGLADRALVTAAYPMLDLYAPWALLPQEAIEMAKGCEQQALEKDKRITNSDGVSVSTYTFCHGYADTHGFGDVVRSSRHSLSCSLIARQGENMQRDYDYTTARHAAELRSVEHLAARVAERTTSRLGAIKLKTQKVPVVFSPRVSGGLFSSFIGAISGSNLYRKHSFLLDALGHAVFPEFVRVYEQPHVLRGLGSSPFDGEGVLTRNNVFVESGRLQQYVLGSYSARKMGLETTANSGGVFNLTVDPTAGDLKAVLQLMGTGLLVTELMGQGVNGLTGDYSRGASGFWVENGVIQYPVEGITIAGNLKDMFRQIVAIGQDISPDSSTRCGSVLIEEMMVAGD